MIRKTIITGVAFTAFAVLVLLPLLYVQSAPGALNPNVSIYNKALSDHQPMVVNISSST